MEVGSEALAALRACKGPVGVVAVAGRARSGKSFVLNAILRRAAAARGAAEAGGGQGDEEEDDVCAPGGFALAHSYRPCTKGLWLWSSPVGPVDSLTGRQQQQQRQPQQSQQPQQRGEHPRHPRPPPPAGQHHLVLLDTEGIDAYDQTTTDGVRVFALAVLLSSLFVFNQFGAIDEAALDRLSLVTELTRHIRVRAKGTGTGGKGEAGDGDGDGDGGDGDEDEDGEEEEEEDRRMRALGAVNPRLLWLLRDFYFDLDEEERSDDDEEEEASFGGSDEGDGRAPSAPAPLPRPRAPSSSSSPPSAPGPGDVRASATFEGGWPPVLASGVERSGRLTGPDGEEAAVKEEEVAEEDEARGGGGKGGGGGRPSAAAAAAAAAKGAVPHASQRHRRPRTTPSDYLEAALAPARRAGGGGGGGPHAHAHAQAHAQAAAAALASKNSVRASIKALFPDRDCFTLVRPVAEERALRRLDALPASALRPEFRRAVGRLARLVLERAGPKTVAGHVVTGPVLAGLAEAYVAAINAGAVPTIATAWQGVAERECARAARRAEDAYAAAFGGGGGGSAVGGGGRGAAGQSRPPLNEPEALDAEHRRALAVARRVFAEEAVGGEEEGEEEAEAEGEDGGAEGAAEDGKPAPAPRSSSLSTNTNSKSTSARAVARRALEASLARRFALVRARALADADAHAERLLSQGRQRVAAAARLGAGGWRDVGAAVESVQSEYASTAGGTSKWPRLLAFVREAYDAAGGEVAERLKAAAEARIASAELAAREAAVGEREQRQRAAAAEASLARERRLAAASEAGAGARGGVGGGGPGAGASSSGNGLLAWLGCLGRGQASAAL